MSPNNTPCAIVLITGLAGSLSAGTAAGQVGIDAGSIQIDSFIGIGSSLGPSGADVTEA